MNIVLIGYRGSGKTTVGRKLSERLGLSFVDVDDEVCARSGAATIRQFWQSHGEAAFRQQEAAVTADLLGRDGQVIALGGGTVLSEAARRAIAQANDTVRIYLRCAAAELSRRITADPARQDTRPSSGDAAASSTQRVGDMLAQREPLYEQAADHVLDVDELDQQQAAQYIIEHWI